MVHQILLKGHQAPVLSLAHSSTSHATNQKRPKKSGCSNSSSANNNKPCCLLSGSEDGTTRLWDLRSSSRAALCILAPSECVVKDVTAVGFHPIMDHRAKEEEECGDLSSTNPCHDFTIYTAVGSNVYGYDLRNTNSPIIRKHDFHLDSLTGGDEINQLSFGELNKKIYMAVGDDDGKIRITNSVPNRRNRTTNVASRGPVTNSCPTLIHNPDESALVTNVAFRPRTKNLDLVTAGTDCCICLWDVSRPRRPSSTLQVSREEAEGANQVCNPPIVHSISWSPSGRLLAAGLGDGSSMVMRVEGRRLVESCRLHGGHDSAVATVLFPHFECTASTSSHIAAEDRLMVSGGNDGAIYLWDLGGDVGGDAAVDPSMIFQGCGGASSSSAADVNNTLNNLSISSEPTILFGIPHEKKLNWIVSSKATEPVLSTTLFVADTSNDITAYMLPTV